jgi:kynurenine 3-monooxygenase
MPAITPHLVPMRGRCIHERDGSRRRIAYGKDAHEVIYSISRATLARVLIDCAAREPRVTMHFRQTCMAARPERAVLELRAESSGEPYAIPLAPTIAADGAGSAVRTSLAHAGLLHAREEMLTHDYKEISIPADRARDALERDALHIWPRGGFMLIALPNVDGSFTATLFLEREGPPGFAWLRDEAALLDFFSREFPDVLPLMPQLVEEFREHEEGRLGTVHCDRWHLGGSMVLLGDAAHAMVPFHGQGMNCAFEDCSALDALVARGGAWSRVFEEFERERRPNADAIARMALENYVEMRDSVRDPRFLRQNALSRELELRFPGRFIPRYSMVMFHPEIPYAQALERGAIQQSLLDEIDAHPALDVRSLVESRLPPLPPPPPAPPGPV